MKLLRGVIISGVLLGLPVACVGGFVASQSRACHSPQTYLSGTHFGYRVGMTREEAVDASAGLPRAGRLFAIWDRDEIQPDITVPRRNERFVQSLADLRAPG
jgi:hypothetical protein